MTLRDLKDAVDAAIEDFGEDALVYLNTNLKDPEEVLAATMMMHSCKRYPDSVVIGPYRMIPPGLPMIPISQLPEKIYYMAPNGALDRYFPDMDWD